MTPRLVTKSSRLSSSLPSTEVGAREESVRLESVDILEGDSPAIPNGGVGTSFQTVYVNGFQQFWTVTRALAWMRTEYNQNGDRRNIFSGHAFVLGVGR